MKKSILVSITVSLFLAVPSQAIKIGGNDMLNLDLSSAMIVNQIQGNEQNSIMSQGLFTEHYLTAMAIKNFDSFYIRTNVTAKYTDEPNLKGLDYFELQKFLLEAGSGFAKLSAGDFYTNYSRYTMGQAARGVMAMISGLDFSVQPFVGRVVAPRENAVYARYAGGVRINKMFGRLLEVGVNYVTAYDDGDSISDQTGLLSTLKNSVYSADFKVNLSRGFRFAGEVSQSSYTNESTGEENKDISMFLQNRFTFSGFRGFAEFERVGTNFNSLTGFATPDKQIIKGNVSKYFFNQLLRMYVYGERYNNNINGEAASTLVSYTPKAGIDLYYKGLGINLSSKFTDRKNSTLADNLNLVYSADGFFKVAMVRVNASYEYSDYQDRQNNDNNYSTNYILGTVKVPLTFKAGFLNCLTPGFTYSINNESITYDDNGTITSGNNVTNSQRISLSSKLLGCLDVGGLVNFSNSTRANAADTNRQDINVTIGYHVNEQGSIKVVGEYMASKFASAFPTNDYTTQTGKVRVNLRF